jgi:hypothetical protein
MKICLPQFAACCVCLGIWIDAAKLPPQPTRAAIRVCNLRRCRERAMQRFRGVKNLHKFSSVRSTRSRSRGSRGLAAVWGLICLSAFSTLQADAEVVVDGGRGDMQVRVENDTVAHVLEALGQNGDLHYGSAAPLDKVIGGSYSGSLGHVLSRVLVGFDFVVYYNPQGVEVFVYEASGEAPPMPPPQIAAPSSTSVFLPNHTRVHTGRP